MFTGIIIDVGSVKDIVLNEIGYSLKIETTFNTEDILIGASIACNGACLTVVEKGNNWFSADVSGETLDCTSLGDWSINTRVNIETALKAGDELGGHLVQGHVDGIGSLVACVSEGENHRLTIKTESEIIEFIASKGSIAVDGVSLTVNEIHFNQFGVNIIPHTWKNTNFSYLKINDKVNLEIDIVARYVARLMERS